MRGTSRTGKSVSRAWGLLSRNPTDMPVLCSKACSALLVGTSFSLSSCPYKISQQSHKSGPYAFFAQCAKNDAHPCNARDIAFYYSCDKLYQVISTSISITSTE